MNCEQALCRQDQESTIKDSPNTCVAMIRVICGIADAFCTFRSVRHGPCPSVARPQRPQLPAAGNSENKTLSATLWNVSKFFDTDVGSLPARSVAQGAEPHLPGIPPERDVSVSPAIRAWHSGKLEARTHDTHGVSENLILGVPYHPLVLCTIMFRSHFQSFDQNLWDLEELRRQTSSSASMDEVATYGTPLIVDKKSIKKYQTALQSFQCAKTKAPNVLVRIDLVEIRWNGVKRLKEETWGNDLTWNLTSSPRILVKDLSRSRECSKGRAGSILNRNQCLFRMRMLKDVEDVELSCKALKLVQGIPARNARHSRV